MHVRPALVLANERRFTFDPVPEASFYGRAVLLPGACSRSARGKSHVDSQSRPMDAQTEVDAAAVSAPAG
jgi:hypothetical protein